MLSWSEILMEVILVISLTINASVVIFLVTRRLLRAITGQTSLCRGKFLSVLYSMCRKHKLKMPRLLTTALSVVTLAVMITVTIATDNALLDKTFTRQSSTVTMVFSVHIGRSLYRLGQDGLTDLKVPMFKTDAICYLVTATCYTIFSIYQQNALLGCVGVLCESDSVLSDLREVLKDVIATKSDNAYFYAVIVQVLLCGLLRVCLPGLVLVYAVYTESPFNMHSLPLSAFFSSAVFSAIVNLLKFKTVTHTLWRLYNTRCRCQTSDIIAPLSDHITIHILKNDMSYKKAYSNINLHSNHDLPCNIQQSKDKVTFKEVICP